MSAAVKVLVNDIIVVEHILKFIEMVLKCENDFEISEFYPARTFSKSRKMIFLKIPSEIVSGSLGGEVGSTSPPGGNQVDGLPPASTLGGDDS